MASIARMAAPLALVLVVVLTAVLTVAAIVRTDPQQQRAEEWQ